MDTVIRKEWRGTGFEVKETLFGREGVVTGKPMSWTRGPWQVAQVMLTLAPAGGISKSFIFP